MPHLIKAHFGRAAALLAFGLSSTPAWAGDKEAAPDSIDIYFASGSTAIRPADLGKLDHAARLFRAASPIIMQVSGTADSTGSAEANLRLSQERANNVLRGLVERGIPAARFQVLAKGVTDPPVQSPPGTPEERNRLVRITWR